MRSELVIAATKYVANRYLLMRAASNAVRNLHKPNTRIQETMNHVFFLFNRADPIVAALPSRHPEDEG
jgi:hypothetical protein